MNIRKLSSLILVLVLSACNAMMEPLKTDYDALDGARSAIDRARSAGAEDCAPEAMSDAVVAFYHAAHELSEGSVHPEETSGLIATAEARANDAYNQTSGKCGAKLAGVKFGFDSASLTAAATATLDRAAATLKAKSGAKVKVSGHTDSRGDAGYNQGLSVRRAANVKQYLSGRGVGGISSKSYGESKPVASNDTDTGRAENRRAEVWLIEK